MQNLKVKTLVLILLGVMVVGGLGYGGYRLWNKEKPKENGNTNQSTQSATTQYTWQTYHNDEFGFSFEYPTDWQMNDFQVSHPDSFSEQPLITSLMNNKNTINFNINTDQPLLGSERNLEKKYMCQVGTTLDGKPINPAKPNAIIGGKEGFFTKGEREWLDVCVQNNNNTISIQYIYYLSPSMVKQEGLVVFKHVLESFKFDGVEPKSVLPDF